MRNTNKNQMIRTTLYLLMASLLLAGTAVAQQRKPHVAQLPAFSFQRAEAGQEQQVLTRQQLKQGYATIVIYYDPFCDHCQAQAKWLAADGAKLGKTQLLWVTISEAADVQHFQKTYLPKPILPTYWVRDTKYVFDDVFGYSVAPTVLVYDAAGKLKKAYNNEVGVDELVNALK